MIERAGWYQLVTPSVADVSLNEVILSRVPEAEVARSVDEAFAAYAEHRLPFKWCIGPMSAPSVEGRIASHAAESWHYRGMVAPTDLAVASSDGVTVEPLGAGNWDEFLEVFVRGWSMQSQRHRAEAKKPVILAPASPYRYFLARHRGVAVGCSGTIVRSDCGYLVGSVVLPEHRGLGAYRALVRARLGDLRASGFALAVTHARDATSAPILERAGFETAFRAKIYRFEG